MGRILEGQTAWISGAASGIGAATARLFAEEGANVALADLRVASPSDLGGNTLSLTVDVSVEAEVRDSMARTVDQFGGLNIVVNCAGLVHVGLLHEYEAADWDRLMGVNLKSIFFAVKHGIPHLRRNARSTMVNVGSISSLVGQARTPAYTASKHAVLGLTRSIALDYAEVGLRCNCICPGITDTPMLREHLDHGEAFDSALARRLRRVPTRAALSPEDVARSILYLGSEQSSGVTGTSLVIDGGYLSAAEWDAG